jgi:Kef-type K+ transport system membrane component KefB
MTTGVVFLAQALIVVVLPSVVFRVLRVNGLMPLVVVQILVGIALGPSLFGRLAPETYQLLFNPAALDPLSGIAWIGVLFFSFITGLHLDPGMIGGRGRAFASMAASSIVVPTVFGFLAGLWIAARYAAELGAQVGPTAFAMAVGICIGTTALPVLSAVLREMDLLASRIGQLALGIAAVNDMTLWLLLGALLTAVTASGASTGAGMLADVLILLVYLAAMVTVVRPLFGRLIAARMRGGRLDDGALVIVCGVIVASAMVTEATGMHYILGAFIAGAVMPHDVRRPILDRLQDMTIWVLMPFYFMLTGLRTSIDLGSPAFVEIFAVTTVLAVAGKVGGTALTARLTGEPWPVAFGLGALVQTKGLMEVIVLTILLDSRIISANVFSALVLMAVVSTALAMPLTRLALTPRGSIAGIAGRPSFGND